jgi:hypothetical protein
LRLGTVAALLIATGTTANKFPENWSEAVRGYRTAENAYLAEKWGEAQKAYTGAAVLYPSSRVLQYNLAEAASRSGDSRTALRALDQALRLGFHGFLQDDADLAPLQAAPEWPEYVRKYERAEKRWRASHTDPGRITIHTEDIQRFWQVWDQIRGKPPAEWPAALVKGYLNPGSEGLKEYYLTKCREPEKFSEALQKRTEFYDAIRSTTLSLEQEKSTIRESFTKMKQIYRDAVFPDLYFVIGQLTSGGTASVAGLLIGVEMSAIGPRTPLESLSAWERANVSSWERSPGLIAHELVHYQQKGSGESTLLSQALTEGAADFIAARIAHVIPNDGWRSTRRRTRQTSGSDSPRRRTAGIRSTGCTARRPCKACLPTWGIGPDAASARAITRVRKTRRAHSKKSSKSGGRGISTRGASSLRVETAA